MIFAQILKIIDPIAVKLDRWTLEGYRLLPNLLLAATDPGCFQDFGQVRGQGYGKIIGTRFAEYRTGRPDFSNHPHCDHYDRLVFCIGCLGLDKTVTSLLAGAGVLALALGFAFQDLTTNFISGAFIAIQRPIKVGDVIETNGFTGKVLSIGLRSVKLDNFEGQQVELPSKDIFQKPIVNFTNSGERRVQMEGSIGYKDDLSIVEPWRWA
jgi:small conductance mechanosensitive channel